MLFVRGVAQLASALAWGARGRKFESSRPDKKREKQSFLSFFCFRWFSIRSVPMSKVCCCLSLSEGWLTV